MVEVISSKVDTVWDLLAGEVGLYFLIAISQLHKFEIRISGEASVSDQSETIFKSQILKISRSKIRTFEFRLPSPKRLRAGRCFGFRVSHAPILRGGLGSFEEIDPISFFQSDNGLLPVRPLPLFSTQSLHFTHDPAGAHLKDLDLEETLDSRLDVNLVCLRIHLEGILVAFLFLLSAFFRNPRSSDNLMGFLHDASTP